MSYAKLNYFYKKLNDKLYFMVLYLKNLNKKYGFKYILYVVIYLFLQKRGNKLST